MNECGPEQSAIVASTSPIRKHQARYDHVFKVFKEWCAKNSITDYSENVLCAYFVELSKKYKSSSLWSLHSMLKWEILCHNNVDIYRYKKLKRFLRHTTEGHVTRKSKALTKAQIDEFLMTAPDNKYLSYKVILLIGVTTGCGSRMLVQLELKDIKDMGTHFSIAIPAYCRRKPSEYIIEESEYIRIIREYSNARPKNWSAQRFFYRYLGRGIKQLIGLNNLAAVLKMIAKYLSLPNTEEYTGQSMRRSAQAFNAARNMKGIETVWLNNCRQLKEEEEKEEDEVEEVDEEEEEEAIDEYGEYIIMDTMPPISPHEQEKQLGDSHKVDVDKKLPPEDSATNGTDVVVQREQDAVENGNTAMPANMDATDMFFLSMARMTKRLPLVTQARIKHLLGDAVLTAEIESEQTSSKP